MLNTRPLRLTGKVQTSFQFGPKTLHRAAALSILAPHSALSPTSSRAQQISQHLSTKTPKPITMSSFAVRKNGAPNTLEHRIYIEKDGVPVSPFHDIPLYANEQQTVLNMIVEIPRWTNAKMEVPF